MSMTNSTNSKLSLTPTSAGIKSWLMKNIGSYHCLLAVLHSLNLTSSDYKLLHIQGQFSLPLLPCHRRYVGSL